MSLYDKYFSDINRNHVYTLLCKSIQTDFGCNVTHDIHFKERYNQIYPRIFREIDTDNLIDLNKALIDRMAEPFTIPLQPLAKAPPNAQPMNIYSSNRLLSSSNRYDYTVRVEPGKYTLTKITLPQENSSLFSGTTVQITFMSHGQSVTTICELVHTRIVNDKPYLTYHPQTSLTLQSTDKIHIQIKDRNGHVPIVKTSDICKIRLVKKIDDIFTGLTLQNMPSQTDLVGLFGSEGYASEVEIVKSQPPHVMIRNFTGDNTHSLIDMSLQNHIQMSYTK